MGVKEIVVDVPTTQSISVCDSCKITDPHSIQQLRINYGWSVVRVKHNFAFYEKDVCPDCVERKLFYGT